MCMSNNATLIDQIVAEFLALKGTQDIRRMFSAYDVTREAKTRGATEAHFHMKSQVHRNWDDLQLHGYSRSLVPTPTGDTWLYFPDGDNPQDWLDAKFPGSNIVFSGTVSKGNAVLPSPNVTLPSPNASNSSQSAQSSMTVVSKAVNVTVQNVDVDGRLPIYNDTLSQIGIKPGDSVGVFLNPSVSIEVKPLAKQSNHATPLETYTANKDGRIRLRSGIVGMLGKMNAYIVDVVGGTVVVRT